MASTVTQLIAVLLCLFVCQVAPQSCTYTSPHTGYQYDLSGMTHKPGEPDLFIKDTGGNTLYVNVCGTTTTGCIPPMEVCEEGPNMKYYGLGTLQSQTFSGGDDGTGVVISVGDGTTCGSGMPRNSSLIVQCAPSQSGYGIIESESESDCTYTFIIKSKYACPLNGPQCSYVSSDGNYNYDLSPMTHPAGTPDSLVFKDLNGNLFSVNVCGETTTSCDPPMSVCQEATNNKLYGCGTLASQRFYDGEDPSNGVTIVYSNGTACGNGEPRTSMLQVSCDPRASGYGVITNVTEQFCNYVVQIKSKYGCPITSTCTSNAVEACTSSYTSCVGIPGGDLTATDDCECLYQLGDCLWTHSCEEAYAVYQSVCPVYCDPAKCL